MSNKNIESQKPNEPRENFLQELGARIKKLLPITEPPATESQKPTETQLHFLQAANPKVREIPTRPELGLNPSLDDLRSYSLNHIEFEAIKDEFGQQRDLLMSLIEITDRVAEEDRPLIFKTVRTLVDSPDPRNPLVPIELAGIGMVYPERYEGILSATSEVMGVLTEIDKRGLGPKFLKFFQEFE